MIKFGTGGWRAIIGDEFTKTNIKRLSQAIANYSIAHFSEDDEKALVIGYDRRFMSHRAAIWVAEVLIANDLKVYMINEEAPTPMTMYTIGDMGLRFGLAITASHNSYEWNGIKFFVDGGKDAPIEVTNDLEARVEKIDSNNIKTEAYLDLEYQRKENLAIINPLNSYIDKILSLIDVEKIKNSDLKILLDPMHGVSRVAVQSLLINCRVRLDTINDSHDVMFGGNMPSPSSANLQKLRQMVADQDYDLGIATDGDADRIGLVSEKGQYIHANGILILLYYYFLEYKKIESPIVRNLATTHILDRIARHYGQKVVETNVGFKYITAGMEAHNAVLGGESSGGLATKGHIRGKDSIYSAALIVEMLSVLDKPLSKILEEIYNKFGRLYMVERSYKITEKLKEEITKLVFDNESLPEFPVKIVKISKKDGMKIYFKNDSWLLVRFSGTEPVIRIYSEMEDENLANTVCDIMQDHLNLYKSMLSH